MTGWRVDELFWRIIDQNWTPHEQNQLARLWKHLEDMRKAGR